MRFLILSRSVGLKKKPKKQNHKKCRNRRPWYPRTMLKVNVHIFGLTKYTIYCKNVYVFVPVFLYAVTMLIFQIKRIMLWLLILLLVFDNSYFIWLNKIQHLKLNQVSQLLQFWYSTASSCSHFCLVTQRSSSLVGEECCVAQHGSNMTFQPLFH